jgi:hypothetical protein
MKKTNRSKLELADVTDLSSAEVIKSVRKRDRSGISPFARKKRFENDIMRRRFSLKNMTEIYNYLNTAL